MPVHVEDFRPRPDVFLGRLMAIKTPAHEQRVLPPRQRHLVHLPVTRHASDPLAYVNAVIELHEVGEVVDPDPLQVRVGLQA